MTDSDTAVLLFCNVIMSEPHSFHYMITVVLTLKFAVNKYSLQYFKCASINMVKKDRGTLC